MPSTPSTIRLAFVAALAAFALGACSGGGGKPTTTAGTMTPAPGATPTTGTPTAGDRTDFFPIKSGQVTRGTVTPAAGSTLETIVTGETAQQGFPQFSVFEFGAATNANGIPLQKATKMETGRYSAVAYQAVLEHSMFLFQGGIYNQRFPRERLWPDSLQFSTGTPSTGNPVAGTWTGRAVAREHALTQPAIYADYSLTDPDHPESLIVQGDVEIGVTLDGSNQNVTWAFRDWEGGRVDYPDVTSEGTRVYTAEDIEAVLRQSQGLDEREIAQARTAVTSNDHYLAFWDPEGEGGRNWRAVGIQFYGPGRAEAGGTFGFHLQLESETYILNGAFAAKKQP